MDDDKIKNIFSAFNPRLSSSRQFIDRLQSNMEAVEIVKQHNAALRRRNRIAVAMAAVAGFATGVILTLMFPLICNLLADVNLSLLYLNIPELNINNEIGAWIVVAAASVMAALGTYERVTARSVTKIRG